MVRSHWWLVFDPDGRPAVNMFQDHRPTYGQDPHVSILNNTIILCESVDEKRIAISLLDSLQSPRRKVTEIVWDSPQEHQVWAPELHYIGGLWYIFYSASDGINSNHRNYFIQGVTLTGPYYWRSPIGPDIWGIDLTQFKWKDSRYAVWSGWEKNGDEFPQHLYIAKMYAPWQLGRRVKLASPEYEWEKSVAPILEGPQAFIKDGMLRLLYSGNASWTQGYSTGIMTLVGDNPLNPEHWTRRETPILQNAGHGCVVDGYLVYHRKMSAWPGWSDREIVSLNLGLNGIDCG